MSLLYLGCSFSSHVILISDSGHLHKLVFVLFVLSLFLCFFSCFRLFFSQVSHYFVFSLTSSFCSIFPFYLLPFSCFAFPMHSSSLVAWSESAVLSSSLCEPADHGIGSCYRPLPWLAAHLGTVQGPMRRLDGYMDWKGDQPKKGERPVVDHLRLIFLSHGSHSESRG